MKNKRNGVISSNENKKILVIRRIFKQGKAGENIKDYGTINVQDLLPQYSLPYNNRPNKGHMVLPPQNKTTKCYLIPQLVAIEEVRI